MPGAYANIDPSNPASGVPNGVPLPPDLRSYFLNFGDTGAGFWRYLQGPDAGGNYGGNPASFTKGYRLPPDQVPNQIPQGPGYADIGGSAIAPGAALGLPMSGTARLGSPDDNSVANNSWNYQGLDPLARFTQANFDRYQNMWKAASADEPGLGFYDYLRTRVNPQADFAMQTPAQQGFFSSVVTPRGRMVVR